MRDDNIGHIDTSSLIVWYQAHLNRYNTVTASNNAIDNKSGVLLATNIAVLIFCAPSVLSQLSLLGIMGTLGLIISIGIAIVNIHVRDARDEVVTSEERIDYYDMKDHEFTWQLLSDLEEAIKHNKNINTRKAMLYYWVAYTFLFSSILLLLSNFVTITFITS